MGLRLDGAKEFEAAMKQLKMAAAVNTARRVMRAALQPVAEAARASAPRSDDGSHMADQIFVSVRLSKRQARQAKAERGEGVQTMYVGPKSPLAHLVEFGTGPRFWKNGKSTGSMPPQPFMRPAWDANAGRVLDILRDEMRKVLARLAKRGG